MNTLTHKSVDVRPEIWKRLRINAELSDVSLRDYLTFLVERSDPVPEDDEAARKLLGEVAACNRLARGNMAPNG